MALEIIRSDITKMQVDAIVNTASPEPVVGDGTDRAVHEAAGPELYRARLKIGSIQRGESAITPAFGLDAKYVIHTVGPRWADGTQGETEVLKRCYESAFDLALAHGCRSMAFPLISSGHYGFPRDLALSVAVRACSEFLLNHQMKIYIVVFDRQSFRLSRQLMGRVRSFIDEHYVSRQMARESGHRGRAGAWMQCEESICYAPSCIPEPEELLKQKLEQRLHEQHETFTQAMLRIIREKNLLEPEVYGRIFMDRKTFNKIRNNPGHHPQKKTAVQLAVALRLNLDQARDFIGRAGYAFTETSMSDVILMFCFENEIYDTEEIDSILDQYGQSTLFSAA